MTKTLPLGDTKMTPFDIFVQAIGIIAMCFNIFSFQLKTSTKVIVCQLIGASFFAVHFFLLGATVGGLLNLVAIFRAIIFSNPEKFRAKHIGWLVLFVALFVLSYVLSFTVFGKPFTLGNALLEILPVVGLTASTVSFRLDSGAAIRRYGLICSPCWLIYNVVNQSIGASICEAVSIISIFIGMFRHDIKRKGR